MNVPIIKSSEVEVTDQILGSGGFCNVSPVRSINIIQNNNNPTSNSRPTTASRNQQRKNNTKQENVQGASKPQSLCTESTSTSTTTTTITTSPQDKDRSKFAKQFTNYKEKYHSYKQIVVPGHYEPKMDLLLEQRPPRIALKRVRPTLGEEKYRIGTRDLAKEAMVLAQCCHSNIISLYAVGCDDREYDLKHACNEVEDEDYDLDSSDDNHPNRSQQQIPAQISFVIIDQLRYTLRSKLYQWNEEKGIFSNFSFTLSKKTKDLWLERLLVIHDITHAIQYLHSKGMIHRDINPDNIGFSDDGTVKLFDFGLVKCVAGESDRCNREGEGTDEDSKNDTMGDENQQLDLTSMTGTIRYMGPEVGLELPYGYKVDVYSMAIVIHEILSLKKPFIGIKDVESFKREVMIGGLRPQVDESWPTMVQTLLRRMWSSDVAKRPTSKEVVGVLGKMMRGDDCDLFPDSQGIFFKLK